MDESPIVRTDDWDGGTPPARASTRDGASHIPTGKIKTLLTTSSNCYASPLLFQSCVCFHIYLLALAFPYRNHKDNHALILHLIHQTIP